MSLSEVGFEPTPSFEDQKSQIREKGTSLESGALDRSTILTCWYLSERIYIFNIQKILIKIVKLLAILENEKSALKSLNFDDSKYFFSFFCENDLLMYHLFSISCCYFCYQSWRIDLEHPCILFYFVHSKARHKLFDSKQIYLSTMFLA